MKPSTYHVEAIYNEISETYEEKYVAGGFQNSYMVDEFHAKTWWLWSRLKGRIVSLGVGSGQDIEILGHPDPADFHWLRHQRRHVGKRQTKVSCLC
jgi:hypothetical protein